jgi:hypothetical protein
MPGIHNPDRPSESHRDMTLGARSWAPASSAIGLTQDLIADVQGHTLAQQWLDLLQHTAGLTDLQTLAILTFQHGSGLTTNGRPPA